MIAYARDGRRQRVDPDPAAGAAAADVRRVRPVTPAATSVHFVAPAALEGGLADRLGRAPAAGAGARHAAGSTKADMPSNDALPRIEVEPDTFTVRIDGEVVEPAPAAELPMAQRYFLF